MMGIPSDEIGELAAHQESIQMLIQNLQQGIYDPHWAASSVNSSVKQTLNPKFIAPYQAYVHTLENQWLTAYKLIQNTPNNDIKVNKYNILIGLANKLEHFIKKYVDKDGNQQLKSDKLKHFQNYKSDFFVIGKSNSEKLLNSWVEAMSGGRRLPSKKRATVKKSKKSKKSKKTLKRKH